MCRKGIRINIPEPYIGYFYGNVNERGDVSHCPRKSSLFFLTILISDGECYTIGAVVADHLQMPSLTQVIKIYVTDGKLRCERQAEYGYDTVEIELPAVISVGDAINEPRYPSLKAIMGAKKKPLDSKATGDVGIDAGLVGEGGSKTKVLALNPPPAKEAGEIIEDEDTNETVEKIVAWLDERKLI
jgi:electron transfer flavoprotein beta subunit